MLIVNLFQTEVSLFIPAMDLAMDDQQGMEMIALSTNLLNYSVVQQQSEQRPTVSIRRDPAAWWR